MKDNFFETAAWQEVKMTFGFFYLLNSYVPSATVRITTATLLQRCVQIG